MASPLRWWSPTHEGAKHTTWLGQAVAAPIRWEDTSWSELQTAGTPVILTEPDGHQHLMYVGLRGAQFQRWCSGEPGAPPRLALRELTTRDPMELWGDPWILQLGLAITSTSDNWLADAFDPDDGSELASLYWDAVEELRPALRPAPCAAGYGASTGELVAQAPLARRGWTAREIEALRQPEGVVEPVDLAPGWIRHRG